MLSFEELGKDFIFFNIRENVVNTKETYSLIKNGKRIQAAFSN